MSFWVILLILFLLNFLIASWVSTKIIRETHSPTKTLAYLLLIYSLPFIGLYIYFQVGINFRKRRLYNKKLQLDRAFFRDVKKGIFPHSEEALAENRNILGDREFVARILLDDSLSPLNSHTGVKLLINGEEKYPELLRAIEQAKDHIHLEYYIFISDEIGERFASALIRKAGEGVKIRIIYDDFGSDMKAEFIERLKSAGIEMYAFYKIHFPLFNNRLNYRDHRKIVVIDGKVGFLGGINIANHYSNEPGILEKNDFFWRDTHIRLDGPAVHALQYIFLATWNFCSGQQLKIREDFFPEFDDTSKGGNDEEVVQITSSGPDSVNSTTFLAFLAAIMVARKRIRIVTPYFIPSISLLDALKAAAMAGVELELIVPEKTDTWIINLAAATYYDELLDVGAKIYRYKKGFVHAKTMTVDGELSIVGTSNMDIRSFDYSFEVNAIIYGRKTASELDNSFDRDLLDSEMIDKEIWQKRGQLRKTKEYAVRMLSSIL